MTPQPYHYRYLIDLLANEGPLRRQQLDQRMREFGRIIETRLQQALRTLVNEGDILETDAPGWYFVAPPRLVFLSERPRIYLLRGHPAAESILVQYGGVGGPDKMGRRYFKPRLSESQLRPRLRRSGIHLEGSQSEPN